MGALILLESTHAKREKEGRVVKKKEKGSVALVDE
jgi:hypothetical protein